MIKLLGNTKYKNPHKKIPTGIKIKNMENYLCNSIIINLEGSLTQPAEVLCTQNSLAICFNEEAISVALFGDHLPSE